MCLPRAGVLQALADFLKAPRAPHGRRPPVPMKRLEVAWFRTELVGYSRGFLLKEGPCLPMATAGFGTKLLETFRRVYGY